MANREIHPCDICEYQGQLVCERPKGKECLQDKQYIISDWQQLTNGLRASYEQGKLDKEIKLMAAAQEELKKHIKLYGKVKYVYWSDIEKVFGEMMKDD